MYLQTNFVLFNAESGRYNKWLVQQMISVSKHEQSIIQLFSIYLTDEMGT